MFDWLTIGTLSLGLVVVLYFGRRALGSRTPYPLPPGPPGLPWVGNVIGVDAGAPWMTYAEWARTYGDIVYSRLLGKDMIILNSEKVAKDLLENRSKNYSDRPYLITNEMSGLGFNSVLMPYGDRWRLHRRFFHLTFRPDAQILGNPEQLSDHVWEYTVSVILNSTYDYDPMSQNDNLLDVMKSLFNIILHAVRPDTAIVIGAFPWLLHFPSWFPGMSFKQQMETARRFSRQYLEQPFKYSLRKMPSNAVAPSMVHDALREMEERGTPPDASWMQALKEAAGTGLLAASESSHSIVMIFVLMMMLNPAVQEKAQAQIDTVVGTARLPTIDDRPSLPFVDAIFWETLRYYPVVPLSVPHAAVDDDVYRGFHIPKGALIVANLWSMAHDESRYHKPHAFNPERFLNVDGSIKPNETEHITYGFGRRMCSGRYFADTSLWAVIAKVLAVFRVLKPLDEHGAEIPVEPKFSSGIAVHPLPFKYRIVPRFPGMDAKKLEQLIAASTA